MTLIDQRSPRPSRRVSRFGLVLLGIALLLFLLFGSVGPYTEYLWFLEDGRQPEIFQIMYEAKGLLFAVGFVVALAMIYLNVSRALKISMVYLDRPSSMGEVLVSRVLTVVQDHGQALTKIGSLAIAFLFGTAFSGEWQPYLLASHSQEFHKVDPIFGYDLGFFVFKLPWMTEVVSFLFGLLVVTTILTAGTYVGLQAIAALGRIELGRSSIRSHLSILSGLTVVMLGVRLWMDRYQYGITQGGQFVGAGYSAMHRLQVQGPLSWLVIAVGIVLCLSPLFTAGWKVVGWGLGTCAAIYGIGLVIYPAIVQAGFVNPNRLTVEAPYAARAIDLTRFAYRLDQVEMKYTAVVGQPTAAGLAASKGTLENIRLWDPTEMQKSTEALQGLKPYYQFNDVDIDRYPISGREQMVMVSPRDINLSGLSANAQNWVNTRLEYTHGYGLTMSPVDTADPSGYPEFIIRDIPTVSPPDLPVTQPRLYFSDFRNSDGSFPDNYCLVDTKVDEFDYPSEQAEPPKNRWTGDRGIRIGPLLQRLAFSLDLGDFNLLISTNVTSNTRLLMHRAIMDRATLLYPFLRFDADPYIVLYQGRLLWILDGYTTSDQIPYSAYTDSDSGAYNYIRNPVKVVVDAYTGETNCYAIDPSEPILKAYEAIYPGLIKSASEIPSGLGAHFRYPEDLFTSQAMQLTEYHVTDPVAFLNNEDAWDMPTERGLSGIEENMRPYYVQMRLPSDPKDEFLLILPFTPRAKGNMSGWLAAHCDPDSYGKLWLYEYPRGSILPGPKQMEAEFNQSPAIANLNTLLANQQSRLLVGNLLVMPIGDSLMYAEPMFLESASQGIQAIPQLKKVVLALKDKVVVADTYEAALQELFGNLGPAPTVESTQQVVNAPAMPVLTGKAASGTVPKTAIIQLLQLEDQAQEALKAGDFGKYGDLEKQLKSGLEELSK